MILYRSSVADFFVLKPCIRICSLDYTIFSHKSERTFIIFLARRYMTLLRNAYVITTSNVQRAIGDVKSIFCKINKDFCQFIFNFVHKVCVFSFLFTYFTYFEQCSNFVIGKLTPRSIRNRFRLIC